jgi:hypothetical protein
MWEKEVKKSEGRSPIRSVLEQTKKPPPLRPPPSPQVNYINCHATSTLVGDIAEVKAIRKVFTDTKNIKMNATKSMIGHCLGAAAGIEAVATVQAIRTGWLHPTLNLENPIDEVSSISIIYFCYVWHLYCGGFYVQPVDR